MPFYIVSSEESSTASGILEGLAIDKSDVDALFYVVTKKEKVSAGKKVYAVNLSKFSDCRGIFAPSAKDIRSEGREILGIGSGCAFEVSENSVPDPKWSIFVQTTSYNRNFPEGSLLGILTPTDVTLDVDAVDSEDYDEDGGVKSKRARKNDAEDDDSDGEGNGDDGDEKYAIKFSAINSIIEDCTEECPEVFEYFNVAVGSVFNGCDQRVSLKAQLATLSWIYKLAGVKWEEVTMKAGDEDLVNHEFLTKVSALGTLADCNDDEDAPSLLNVRLEYRYTSEFNYLAISFGEIWGCMIGDMGSHPFVYSNEIVSDCSDGSFDEFPIFAPCRLTPPTHNHTMGAVGNSVMSIDMCSGFDDNAWRMHTVIGFAVQGLHARCNFC